MPPESASLKSVLVNGRKTVLKVTTRATSAASRSDRHCAQILRALFFEMGRFIPLISNIAVSIAHHFIHERPLLPFRVVDTQAKSGMVHDNATHEGHPEDGDDIQPTETDPVREQQ